MPIPVLGAVCKKEVSLCMCMWASDEGSVEGRSPPSLSQTNPNPKPIRHRYPYASCVWTDAVRCEGVGAAARARRGACHVELPCEL